MVHELKLVWLECETRIWEKVGARVISRGEGLGCLCPGPSKTYTEPGYLRLRWNKVIE